MCLRFTFGITIDDLIAADFGYTITKLTHELQKLALLELFT